MQRSSQRQLKKGAIRKVESASVLVVVAYDMY